MARSPKGIWVYLEHDRGSFEGVALELIAKAKELAAACGDVAQGLLLGSRAAQLAEEALGYGLDEVFVADDALLEEYVTDSYTQAAAALINEHRPNILLIGATANGRDLAGRLAVRFKTGLTADCTNLEMKDYDGERLLAGEVTGFGGGIAAMIICPKGRPQMATVRPGIFKAAAPAHACHGKVTLCNVKIDASNIRTKVLQTQRESSTHDVTKAKYLVIGGRGTKGDFSGIEELARLLKGEVGATRVAVDEGWVSRELQIGQTGYASRPKVAIVCGVSGALQFTVGIAESGKIVSINSDPESPMFESSDYCLVGDMFQILPALIKEVQAAKRSREVESR